ncbi:hypothetical protein [Planococcus halocryophilus]|nr:hypothetical protein [Planococcus halocryophilus]
MKKKKKKDNCITDFFKDLSIQIVFELLLSAVWNTLLFIPRLLIRLFSSV